MAEMDLLFGLFYFASCAVTGFVCYCYGRLKAQIECKRKQQKPMPHESWWKPGGG